VVEDPSSYTYIRPEAGGLMVGLFEPQAAAWNVPKIPTNFAFGEIEPDWERMTPFVEKAMNRVPATLNAGTYGVDVELVLCCAVLCCSLSIPCGFLFYFSIKYSFKICLTMFFCGSQA
jgi:hypothetical protein